jgi:hypothetical protein
VEVGVRRQHRVLESATFPVPVTHQEDRHHHQQRYPETEADQHELVDFSFFDAWDF